MSAAHYQQVRERQIKYAYIRRITEFLNRYVKGRPTIIVLPGGMGSQLCISKKTFKEGKKFSNSKYPVVWYDAGLLFESDLERLEMKRSSAGYEDYKKQIVVPDGEVRFLYKPYDETERFFTNKGYNVLVFGFDWRRSLIEGAGFFQYFLKQLRERTIGEKGENPLTDLTIIGHSQGGLILQMWLLRTFRKQSSSVDVNKWFKYVITVGTPFYGTTNHMQRYFEGEEPFNFLYGKNKIRKILSSFPGTYILMPLDFETYDQIKESVDLPEYPMRDVNGNIADPYDSQNQNFFPDWVSKDALDEAAQLRRTLRTPLCEAVRALVFNLFASGNDKTLVKLTWDKNKSPEDRPIRGERGKGDGTVPEWSGRLAEVPDENIVKLENLDKHVELMEHPDTLTIILDIIKKGSAPKPDQLLHSDHQPNIMSASKDEVDKFLNSIKNKGLKLNDHEATDVRIWKRIMEGLGNAKIED